MNGYIFDIQRFSLDDGPGIRTSVFLKGCNQRCLWCHNPESFLYEPQIMQTKETTEGEKVVGYQVTTNEVTDIVRRDRSYYDISKGGVTFTGGEPTCQAEFLIELLKDCKKLRISTAIETNGNTNREFVKKISKYTDYVMIDLKHIDAKKHLEYTGSDNEKNLWSLAYYMQHNQTEIRIPVIPGFNDSTEELQQMLAYLNRLHAGKVVLLPYHTYGSGKYKNLGYEYKMNHAEPLTEGDVKKKIEQLDIGKLEIEIRR